MSSKAILKEKIVIPCDNLLEWARWFKTANRVVRRDQVGDKLVSTVFLGLDHGFGVRPSLWFETLVLNDDYGNDWREERYQTWDEAELGHARILDEVRKEHENGKTSSET